MNEQDKNIITTRYRDRLQQHGPGDRALASGTTERNAIRFGVLKSVGDLEGKSVLDLGCGLADFYAWLQEQGINVEELETKLDSAPFMGAPVFTMEILMAVPSSASVKALRRAVEELGDALNCDMDLDPA